MTVKITERGKRGFLLWVRANQPQLYARVKNRLPSGGGLSAFGLVDPATTATPAPVTRSFADTFKDLASVVAQSYLTREQAKGQQKILDAQLARAMAGQPPLDIDAARLNLISPQVNVGMDDSTKKLVTYAALGLGGLYILSQLAKRRGS